jgi:TP901 family phage tail tape measure protein
MADIRSNIQVNIDTANAMSAIKSLQAQITAFHSSIRNSGNAANQAVSDNLTKNLLNSVNATKQFSASLTSINDRASSFTNALEKNKFSLGQYFKYGAATSKTFGRAFRKEFDTIELVARDRVKTMQTQFVSLGRTAGGAIEAIKVKPLTLDMQQLGTQVAMTVQKQQLFNKLLTQGSTNLLNFGKNTQWAGRQLMVGITLPLAVLGSTAMKTFNEMEEQAIRFKRVYGELFTTEAETEQMVKQLQDLASEFTKYGVAVADTMSLAADAAAMGKMGADLSAQVAQATRLAVLGGVEQNEALETTISITNAFGIAAEELAGKIDFLNAVENQTVTSIEDLTIAIPKAGPVIEQLGGSVEDLAFFLTAMKEGGINASEGANALKSGLAKMINPTTKATEMLGQLGINLNAIVEGNAGNIKGAVIELSNSLDTLDPLQRARAIEELFGKFQFARISTLFKNVVAEGNQAQRVLELSRSTSEELAILSARELKRVEDSPLFKFQKSIEDLQKALVPLGQQFTELLTPLISFATDLIQRFNGLDEGVKRFVTGTVAVLGLLAPAALMLFGLFANGIANIIKGFGVVRGLFLKVAYAGTGLNSMLDYMTQEHLQATSAANALGTTHGNLTNIFTAEQSAIQNLIASYTQATTAISRFNVASGTRATKGTGNNGMKLASGIVSVPGPKGAGDVVPAMLSPGEAVVPVKQNKKYGALIKGIIADNIPGFASGTPDLMADPGTPRRRPISSQVADLNTINPGVGTRAVKMLQDAKVSASEARRILASLSQISKEGAEAVKNSLTTLEQGISQGLSGENLRKDFRAKTGTAKSGTKAFAHLGSGTSMTREELISAVESGDLKMGPKKLQGIKDLPEGRVVPVKSGLGMAGIDQTVNAQLDRKGASRDDLVKTFDEAGVEKWNKSIEFGGGNVEELSGSVKELDTEMSRLIKNSKADKFFDTEAQARNYEEQTGKKAESVQNVYNQAKAKVRGTKLESVLDDAADTVTETRETGTSPGNSRRPMGKSKKLKEQRLAEQDGASSVRAYKKGQKKELSKDRKSDLYEKNRKRNSPHKLAKKDGADDAKAYGEGTRSQSRKEAKITEAQDKKLRKQAGAQRRAQMGGRAFGALGAASMVAGMGSMVGGPVGDISQKLMGPLMGLSAFAGILPMLMNPIGLVVGALGGLGAAIYLINKRFNDQVKKSYELNTAISASTEAMGMFATAAGKATASQVLDKRRSDSFGTFQVASGKTPFGDNFIESEDGKKLASSFAEALKTFGRNGAIDKLTNQLSSAVSGGAMSAAQARSVAAAFAESIGDRGLGMNVNAQLTALLGPNGERLDTEPLGIRVKIIEESRQQLTNIFGSVIKDAENKISGLGAGYSGYGTIGGGEDPSGTPASANRIGEILAVSTSLINNQKLQEDSLQLSYEQRIEAAKAAKDQQEANKLEAQYIVDRAALMEEGSRNMQEISSAVMGLENSGAVLDQFKKQIEAKFKDDPILSQISGALLDKVAKLPDEQEVIISASLLSGDIEAMTLNNILNGENSEKVIDMIVKMGVVESNRAMALSEFFTGDRQTTNVRQLLSDSSINTSRDVEFLNTINSLDSTEATALLDAFSEVARLSELVGEEGLSNLFAFYQDNPDMLLSMSEDLDAIALAGEKTDGLSVKVIQELVTEGTVQPSVLDAIKANQEYFDSLDKDNKVTYTTILRTLFETGGSLDEQALAKANSINPEINGTKFSDFASRPEVLQVLARNWFTKTYLPSLGSSFIDEVNKETTPTTPTSTGSAVTNPLDAILEKLKRLRDMSIDAKGGIAELTDVIKSGLTKFLGTDQKLLFSGYSADFINAVMAMDEGTRSKFVKISDGALKVTAAGKALNKAYSEIKLGDFSMSLTQGIADVNKQVTAMTKLTSQGMSAADAFDVVKDASLAYAIATAATTGEVDELIKNFEKLQGLQEDFSRSTPDGMASAVSKALGDIKEVFSAQEEAVNLAFESTSDYLTNTTSGLIPLAEKQISDYQSVVGDLNYSLDKIAQQEEVINKKYDDRVESLNRMYEINSDMAEQEKGKLDIASALASGDVAAAAKAIQEQRSKEADRQKQRSQDVIESARQKELGSVLSENGKTRLQIEEELKQLQIQIAEVEQKRLKPNQELLADLTRQRDIALEAIGTDGYLGKTKAEWSLVESGIRLAKTEAVGYKEAIQDALNLIPGLKEAYAGNSVVEEKAPGNGLTDEQNAAIAKIKSNRTSVRDSAGTTVADKALISENIKLIKMLDAAGVDRSLFMSGGGKVPKYFAAGGFARGTDTIPAMLTPGEFVVRKFAVDKFGANNLKAINSGANPGGNMYNSYEVNVNVKSDANADQIAKAVLTQIKQVDAQRMRSNRF